MPDFTAVSLFSGVGGFDLAIRKAGGAIVAQVEKDPFCLSILERHFPEVKIRINDVKAANQDNLPQSRLICGGFPCTGMSVAGKRLGLDDEGSGLWWEFWRLIMELKPGYVLIENVPGLLSSNSGRDFAVILAGLTGILPEVPENGWRNSGFAKGRSDAYHVAYRSLDSQFCGVPQRRRRIFIVGCLASARISPVEILFESEGLSWHPAKSRKKGKTTAATLNAGAPSRRNGGNSPTEGAFVYDPTDTALRSGDVYPSGEIDEESNRNGVAGTLAASGATASRPAGNVNETDLIIPVVNSLIGFAEYSEKFNPTLRANGGDQAGGSEVLISGYYRIKRSDEYDEASVDATLASRDYKSATDVIVESIDVRNLESGGDLSGILQAKENGSYSLNYQNPIAFNWRASNKSDRQRIVRSGDYTGSLQANNQDAIASPKMGIRRLMPIETERLQDFPDSWTALSTDGKPMSDSTRYRMMGNAVTVSMVEWIIRRMIKVDKKNAL